MATNRVSEPSGFGTDAGPRLLQTVGGVLSGYCWLGVGPGRNRTGEWLPAKKLPYHLGYGPQEAGGICPRPFRFNDIPLSFAPGGARARFSANPRHLTVTSIAFPREYGFWEPALRIPWPGRLQPSGLHYYAQEPRPRKVFFSSVISFRLRFLLTPAIFLRLQIKLDSDLETGYRPSEMRRAWQPESMWLRKRRLGRDRDCGKGGTIRG